MAESGLIDGEKPAFLQIKHPHGLRIFGEEKAVLRFGFLKNDFGVLAAHDFRLQGFIGFGKAGRFSLHLFQRN